MSKDCWVYLVHTQGFPTTVSSDAYTTYDQIFETLNKKSDYDVHWADDFNLVTFDGKRRYEIKCVTIQNIGVKQ